jgi:CheY-like chemotaxis protein
MTAESGQSALAKLGEGPSVIVVDTVLGGEDGYALAKEIRRRAPGAPIIMLASRYAPYDQARGRDAGADDWADKPFDTQQLIDKVRKVMLAKEAVAPQASAAPPAPPPTPPAAPPFRAPAQQAPLGRGTQPSLGGSVPGRTGTLVFGEPPPGPGPAPQPPAAPAPPAAPRPMTHASPAPPPVAAAVSSAVNGQLAGKLGELGLTPQQADAVLALSRDVVERVVWEVVPHMAEALIKEEIQRLMKE